MLAKYYKLPEYSQYKMYNDYSFIDKKIYNNMRMDTQKISIKDIWAIDSRFKDVLNKEKIEMKLSEVWKDYPSDGKNYIYTMHDAMEYYELCLKNVREHLNKLKHIAI